MVFGAIKETLRTRRGRSQTPKDILVPAKEEPEPVPSSSDSVSREEQAAMLQETMDIIYRLGHSISSVRLPPLPSFKPLTLAGLDIFKSKEETMEDSATVPAEIRRKPCPADAMKRASMNIFSRALQGFKADAPLRDHFMHLRARKALQRRYESKFEIDFELPEGVRKEQYYSMWCDEYELKRKVLKDIIWVRERYAQANKGEPTDEDIIRWYDAEAFDSGANTSPTFLRPNYWGDRV